MSNLSSNANKFISFGLFVTLWIIITQCNDYNDVTNIVPILKIFNITNTYYRAPTLSEPFSDCVKAIVEIYTSNSKHEVIQNV